MKNLSLLKKAAAAALLFSCIATPAAAADIQISVNGSPLASDVPPAVLNNRTMLPLRACAEALDASLNYDPQTGKIAVYSGQNKIELTLNSRQTLINGAVHLMDTEPQIVNNRTMVPLRFIAEALDARVGWQPEINTVTIISAAPSQTTSTENTGTTSSAGQNTSPALYLPTAETIANQALQQINNVRLQKELSAFIPATELADMAAEHSRNMSEKQLLTNNIPGNPTVSGRASSRKLPIPSELIAKIDYSKENVYQAVSQWFNDNTARSLLLDPSAAYIGISAAYQEGSHEVYLTAEVMPYRAYFCDLPQYSVINADKLTVRGRSQRMQETVTVYKIADNKPQMYTDKQTYTAKGDGTYFYTEISFDAPGVYAIEAEGCMVRVNYKPAA